MDFEIYKNTDPRPNKDQFTTIHAYRQGHSVGLWQGEKVEGSKSITTRDVFKNMHAGATFEIIFDEVAYKAAMTAHRDKTYLLNLKFQKDLIEYEGVGNHPRAVRAFDMAWDRRHGEGFASIAEYFSELAELLR